MRSYLLVIVSVLIFLLGACSGTKVGEENNNHVEDQEQTENKSKKAKDEELADFRNIDITYDKEEEKIRLKGEAISTNRYIYYTVEQEGKEIVPEKEIKLEKERKWENIKLSLEIDKLDNEEEAAIIIFYTKDKKGEPVIPNHHFPINLIQMKEY